jgi:L-serine kinase (ATP) / ParB family transcriptional regulator, heme-responsive regulator
VAPLATIRPHEEVDPLRVDRLAGRIEAEGAQLNPVVCVEDLSGDLVLLDGATRTAALRSLGLGYAVAQIVDERTIGLERWHHVIRDTEPAVVGAQIEAVTELRLVPEEGPPCITVRDGEARTVLGAGLSLFSVLQQLVHAYVGRWTVSRVTDEELGVVPERFPDWTALVKYPTLTMGDVMKAALGEDLLPAGITRFLVPDRALRVNAPLSMLSSRGPFAEKEEALDRLIQVRARTGRIRHYEHGVVLFDE